MWVSFLLSLREGLEAALVFGIVLSVVYRFGIKEYRRAVWAGLVVALALSLSMALGLNALGIVLEGRAEPIFEGSTMVLAAIVLTWMIFWMGKHGRQVQVGLEASLQDAMRRGSRGGLFTLALVSVAREGIELALFLTAASFTARPAEQWFGALLGLGAAALTGWLLFAGGRRVNVRLFFRVTSILLLLFAAGLVGRAVHELQEAGILPTLVEHVWDLNTLLSEKGPLGSFLQSLFGYNANPSLLEALAYTAYTLVVGALTLARTLRPRGLRGSLRDSSDMHETRAGHACP